MPMHENLLKLWVLVKNLKETPRAKKDVIDLEGRSYSVKSGEKKWQIFLYGKTRFEGNYVFKGMRNDSEIHYREVKFWLDRNLTFQLLKSKILPNKKFNERIILYGKAIKKLKSRNS